MSPSDVFTSLNADLRSIAGALMKGERAITLQPTVLIHEAYLRLIQREEFADLERQEFLAIASRVMRNVIVDYARRRSAEKRGGNRNEVTVEIGTNRSARDLHEMIAIDQLLDAMAECDPVAARLAECRIFGDLSVLEAAKVLELKDAEARRAWTFARAWLLSNLQQGFDLDS